MSDYPEHNSHGPFRVNDNPEPLKGSFRYEVVNFEGQPVNSFATEVLAKNYTNWLNSDRLGSINK